MLALSLALVLALAAVPAAADGLQRHREASQGFRCGDALYFVMDYVESRPGATLWFILPFRTGPHVRVHQVVLCRVLASDLRPEAVAVLEEDKTSVLSRNHMFRAQGDRVLVAYDRLWDSGRKKATKEVFAWSPTQARIERTPAGESDAAFAKAFSGYKSPYTANPGIMERSELGGLPAQVDLPAHSP